MKLTRILPALLLAVSALPALAQNVQGFKDDYSTDFTYTVKQLVQLAQAMPAEKFDWRPGPEVRSVGEVYVHIAAGNFLLLSLTGVKLPAEYYPATLDSKDGRAVIAQNNQLEKKITAKADVLKMLQASLDAVQANFTRQTASDFEKPVDFFGQKATVRAIYLRIFAHCNEHMGQSIAYARVNGVVPPWSKPAAKEK
jgi:uncharacterized damage-inducible protein DinB